MAPAQAGADLLACGFAVSHDSFERGRIRHNALVVVEEVAVVGSERIGIGQVAHLGGCDGTGVVLGSDDSCIFIAQLNESVSSDETGKLVLGEAEDVGTGFNVRQDVGSGIAFAYGLYGNGIIRIFGMCCHKGFNLRFGKINNSIGDPDFQCLVPGCACGHCQGKNHAQCNEKGCKFFHLCFFLSSIFRGFAVLFIFYRFSILQSSGNCKKFTELIH